MPNAREADAVTPASGEPSPEDIEAMMAEATALDARLQNERPGPYDVVLTLSAYLSPPLADSKANSGNGSTGR